MINDTYLTIKKPSEGIFKSKGSKFIAYAYNVDNEDEIKTILHTLKKEHFSARHHCWAYRLGYDKKKFRSNDDGEPSNSAGKPILGQIFAFDLTNVLVVVVRYFGGTLLGVGGLIQAYKEATSDALQNSEIVEEIVKEKHTISFPYSSLNHVMKIIKDFNIEIINQLFDNNCLITIKIRHSQSKKVLDLISKIDNSNIQSN